MQFFWNFQLCVWLGRNETIIFIFSLSQHLSTDFGLKWSHNGIFFLFFAIFLEFSITRLVGTERNDNFYSLFLGLFQTILAWKDAIMVFFYFFSFFSFFFEFYIPRRVRTEQNDNFIFPLSDPLSTYISSKWSDNGIV